jgi:hypothetical protein
MGAGILGAQRGHCDRHVCDVDIHECCQYRDDRRICARDEKQDVWQGLGAAGEHEQGQHKWHGGVVARWAGMFMPTLLVGYIVGVVVAALALVWL